MKGRVWVGDDGAVHDTRSAYMKAKYPVNGGVKVYERQSRRKTNVQVVKDIMEHSQYGALVQGFVISCLTKFSNKIVEIGIDEVRRELGINSMVHPDAWFGVAKEVKEKLEAAYGK